MFAIQTCARAIYVVSITERAVEHVKGRQDFTDRRIEIGFHTNDVQPVFGDEGPHHL